MEQLYHTLRALVSSYFKIEICDGKRPHISMQPDDQPTHPWIHFYGKTIEEALKRAIDKLSCPEEDYEDETGHLWKADEQSIYSEVHVRKFLREDSEQTTLP